MLCPNCGKENTDGSKFCTYCGAVMSTPDSYHAPKKSNKGVIIAIIAAALVVVIALVTVFIIVPMFGAQGKTAESETGEPYSEMITDEQGYDVLKEYDAGGNLVKETLYDSGRADAFREYEYDTDGNMVKKIITTFDGSVILWEEYEYNTAGNMVKSTNYMDDGSVWSYTEYEYDSDGNTVKEITYNGDGNMMNWGEYEYTQDNTKIITYYNSDGILTAREEYDADGNMINVTYYNPDGSVKEIGIPETFADGIVLK